MFFRAPAGPRVTHNHPQAKLAQEFSAQLGRLEAEFGMTPASRSRVNVEATAAMFKTESDTRASRYFAD